MNELLAQLDAKAAVARTLAKCLKEAKEALLLAGVEDECDFINEVVEKWTEGQ